MKNQEKTYQNRSRHKKGGDMSKKILEDFRFLFPKKADLYKNFIKDKDLLKKINYEYCLYYYNERKNQDINLVSYLNNNYLETKDGKITFKSQNPEYELNIIKNLITKKMNYFNQLYKYHSAIMLKYKKAGSLSISIRLTPTPGVYIPTREIELKYFIKAFFNNMRSRRAFSENVIGYYWVILLDREIRPYIHINFYLKDKNFNSLIGIDINEICFNTLRKDKVNGQIIHHTLTKSFKNGKGKYDNNDYYEIKNCNFSTISEDFCGTSFNFINDIETKTESYNDLNRGKRFTNHLYLLAKKTYFLPSGRSIGFSSIS